MDVSGRPDLAEYSLPALLQAITSVHPVEAVPPPTVFTTNLRHYQTQSLAFMLQVERNSDVSSVNTTRGGWFADELGMVSKLNCYRGTVETTTNGYT